MIQDSVRDKVDSIRGLGSDDVLSALGLTRKRSVLEVLMPAAGIFVAGVAIGSGVALLLAPKSGRQIRREIKEKANELTERFGTAATEMAHDVPHALAHKAEETVRAARPLENGTRTERKPVEPARESGPQK